MADIKYVDQIKVHYLSTDPEHIYKFRSKTGKFLNNSFVFNDYNNEEQRIGGLSGLMLVGQGTIANGTNKVVGGKFNKNVQDAWLILGNGADDSHRSNALAIRRDSSGNAIMESGKGNVNKKIEEAVYGAMDFQAGACLPHSDYNPFTSGGWSVESGRLIKK